ncbi:hypothetical protein GCM10007315_31020 [Gemmobacter tilapiae]|uniref:Uncharacterized protein n=1 Tax=Neogemmobacter tilapiae TaxID=875041 RepID=A0A918TUS0_9RHOB|nr:hypothetical protein GCM10007315_31020 [Gemmobacter tilapiae]
MQKPPLGPDGFGQGRTFGTQAAKVGGMIRVALDADLIALALDQDAATHPAIGAGGAGCDGFPPSPALPHEGGGGVPYSIGVQR